MKKSVLFIIVSLLLLQSNAQITSPVTRANFGVDADLRGNFFNGAVQGAGDDWFRQAGAGTGQFVIDTTGAAAIVARYASDPSSRRLPFFRTMRFPGFTVVNNRLLLDAVFVRDYHGDDSTVFASGSNKNGDSPVDWSCPVSQGIPDKNDILDMMVHVRRAGPNTTDSLWMMGGLSLDNTTGNRYFDFEMYQTDIYYDRGTRKFYGYGPDAGHTSWEFDAAGNVTKAGDIIFSAEYQSSALTFVEARIWVNRSALSITPVAFSWSGSFDGASNGATYGYASLQPKAAGAYYTGLQCANNTWGGPFSVVLANDAVVTDYTAKQFVEFSVNLTKLGLDPVTLLGGSACGMPFRRVLVKTRSSSSFTAELKDFVGPFDFFLAPRVNALTETPLICESGGVAEIHVVNPVITSQYEWITPDGNIVSGNPGSSIHVDKPGTYIVNQHLQIGCSIYASDTITVASLPLCTVLSSEITDLKGVFNNNKVLLSWKALNNEEVQYFEIQRSLNGSDFATIDRVAKKDNIATAAYSYTDDPGVLTANAIYYRIILIGMGGKFKYSKTIIIPLHQTGENDIIVFPNPAKDVVQLLISSTNNTKVRIDIFDQAGRKLCSQVAEIREGNNILRLDDLMRQPKGIYMAVVYMNDQMLSRKIMLTE